MVNSFLRQWGLPWSDTEWELENKVLLARMQRERREELQLELRLEQWLRGDVLSPLPFVGNRETPYKLLPPPPPTPTRSTENLNQSEAGEPCLLPEVRERSQTVRTTVGSAGIVPNVLSGESTTARVAGVSKAAWRTPPLKNLSPTAKINVWQGAKLLGRTCTLTAGAMGYVEVGLHAAKTAEEISQETGRNLESWNPLVWGPAELGYLIGGLLFD